MRSFFRFCLFIFSIAIIVWGAGFIWYILEINAYKHVQGKMKTDAIVVLTGGSQRIGKGLELLSSHYSQHLFISGVDKGTSVRKLLRDKKYPGNLEAKISLGYMAANTCQNAKEVVEWMESQGLQSMRLVTSHYHMPRSLLEFDSENADLLIVPHAVVPELFRKKDWKSHTEKFCVVFTEYNKFILALVSNKFQ